MMFPRDPRDDRPGPAEGPCPSCVALLDQLDGAVEHASQHLNLAVVAKAPIERVLAFARERGWRRLRLLSSAGTTYNRDYLAETPEGHQRPMLNVFHRDGDTIRHFWGSELFYAPTEPGQDTRHVGTLEPVWNLFDLTREGRGPTGTSSCAIERRAGCAHGHSREGRVGSRRRGRNAAPPEPTTAAARARLGRGHRAHSID